jgi:hypothetical protein
MQDTVHLQPIQDKSDEPAYIYPYQVDLSFTILREFLSNKNVPQHAKEKLVTKLFQPTEAQEKERAKEALESTRIHQSPIFISSIVVHGEMDKVKCCDVDLPHLGKCDTNGIAYLSWRQSAKPGSHGYTEYCNRVFNVKQNLLKLGIADAYRALTSISMEYSDVSRAYYTKGMMKDIMGRIHFNSLELLELSKEWVVSMRVKKLDQDELDHKGARRRIKKELNEQREEEAKILRQ